MRMLREPDLVRGMPFRGMVFSRIQPRLKALGELLPDSAGSRRIFQMWSVERGVSINPTQTEDLRTKATKRTQGTQSSTACDGCGAGIAGLRSAHTYLNCQRTRLRIEALARRAHDGLPSRISILVVSRGGGEKAKC